MSYVEELFQKAKGNDRRAIGRLITILENRMEGYDEIRKTIDIPINKSFVLGITGPPGAGKSSLIARLATELSKDEKLAIIMIDATSPYSGGSLLGNRLRISDEGNAYIRSMSTRGQEGGLNFAIGDVIDLLSYLGFTMIIIESVGAGQDEVDIMYFSDLVILVLAPGLGDEIQAMKAGQMEIGDIIVLTKGDRPESYIAEKQLLEIISIPDNAKPHKFYKISSVTGSGIKELIAEIETEKEKLKKGYENLRYKEKLKNNILAIINLNDGEIEKLSESVAKGELTISSATRLFIQTLCKSL